MVEPAGEVAAEPSALPPAEAGAEAVLEYLPQVVVRKPPVWVAYLVTPILLAVHLGIGFAAGVLLFMYARGVSGSYREAVETFNEIAQSNACVIAMFGVSMGVNAAALGMLVYFSRTPARVRVGLVRPRASVISMGIFALGAVALSLLCGFGMAELEIHSRSLATISRLLASASTGELTVSTIIIALVGPVLEEVMFRGYIQTRLTQRHGPVVAIFVASVFFGMMHFDMVQGTFAFLLGLMLGAIAYRAGSIVPAIVAHVAVNGVSVCLIAWQLDASFTMPMVLGSSLLLPTSVAMLYFTKPVGEGALNR